MINCLYCYNSLEKDEIDFHKSCSREFFGSESPPKIDLEIKDIIELALKALKNKTSVPGVQSKLSLDIFKQKGKESRLTIVGFWGRYILKPPEDKYPEMSELEDLTMHMSEKLEIVTAKHSLVKLKSGELAYISKRFDRLKNDKIHVEDMAQLTETLTENKYRGSMERIGKIILKFSSYSGIDAIRLFELTLFSFITGNSDMHLKNFSLIRNEDEEIMLSPAYDLLSTKLLIPKDKEDLALTLNGKKSNFRKKDFDLFAAQLGINDAALRKIYEKFDNSFPEMNKLINKSFLSKKMKEKYLALLGERRKVLW
jgi:serine/threonine-protein kinase HipA